MNRLIRNRVRHIPFNLEPTATVRPAAAVAIGCGSNDWESLVQIHFDLTDAKGIVAFEGLPGDVELRAGRRGSRDLEDFG